MNTLKSLYRLLSRKRLRKIEVLSDEAGKSSSQALKFYRLLSQANIETDDDLAMALFGKKPDDQFRMLKKRVKALMMNNAFFLDMEKTGFPPRLKKMHECSRNLHVVKMLIFTGNIKGALEIAEATLPAALKFELWNEAIPLLGYLKSIASSQHDRKKYKNYVLLLENAMNAQQADYRADILKTDLELDMRTPGAVPSAQSEKALKSAGIIEESLKHQKTFHSNYIYLLLKKYAFTLADEYDAASVAIKEMQGLFESRPTFVSPEHWSDLYSSKLYVALYQADYALARSAAKKGIAITPKDGMMWFVFHRYYFLVLMHAEDYKEALNINNEILNHPDLKNQIEANKEEWQIYSGYGHLAQNIFLHGSSQNKLRIHKLLNEIIIYRNNKEGLHVAVLVLEVLYYLMNKELSKITDRIEAFRQYKKRNLKIAETTRVRVFIDLLILAEKNSFNKEKTAKSSIGLLKQLREIPRGPQGNIENIEIIPFERLWPWVVDQLV
ncbi:MAG: hypothetical protein WD077_11200 [Bacteroidia bacterium]